MTEKKQEKMAEKNCYICGKKFLDYDWGEISVFNAQYCSSCSFKSRHGGFIVDSLGFGEYEGIYVDLETGKRYYMKVERIMSEAPLLVTRLVKRKELKPEEYTFESRIKKYNEAHPDKPFNDEELIAKYAYFKRKFAT